MLGSKEWPGQEVCSNPSTDHLLETNQIPLAQFSS